jgi:hypothetical protein
MTAHHQFDRPATDWCEPYAGIIAKLREAQVADGRCEYEDQLASVEDAIEQLDKLRLILEVALFEPHLRAADYRMGGAE